MRVGWGRIHVKIGGRESYLRPHLGKDLLIIQQKLLTLDLRDIVNQLYWKNVIALPALEIDKTRAERLITTEIPLQDEFVLLEEIHKNFATDLLLIDILQKGTEEKVRNSTVDDLLTTIHHNILATLHPELQKALKAIEEATHHEGEEEVEGYIERTQDYLKVQKLPQLIEVPLLVGLGQVILS